jgi:acetyl esterase/lipase
MATAHGIIFISPDYHLLCPSTGFDQIADVKALFRFLSTDVNAHLSGVTLDASRIGITGVSAGAYIGRLAALYAEPRPRAILSLFGMGGDWFSDFYLTLKAAPIPLFGPLVPQEVGAELVKFEKMDPVVEAPLKSCGARSKLLPWWWQNGIVLDYLIGKAGLSERLRALPAAEREAAIPANVAALFPQLHINSSHPPTMFIHGKDDTAVLVAESEYAHEQLQKAGVRSELHIVPGAEHGLVVLPSWKQVPEAAGLYKQGFEFLTKEIA